jgi:hypothetical protein
VRQNGTFRSSRRARRIDDTRGRIAIKNCVRTIGRGLQLYAANLRDNLLAGIQDWLFSQLGERGIQRPTSWTNPWDLAAFAASVMGLTMNHVFDLMIRARIDPQTVQRLRVGYGRLTRAWDWVMEMRGKSPAEVTTAIMTSAKDFAKTIFEGMVTWIVQRVAAELAVMATAAAASAGLSEVVDAIRRIYIAINWAVRWMRQILEMVDTALDSVINIAAGTIEPAALLLTNAFKRATPVVIGFLAAQVGLGGVPQKIADIVDSLRAKVDEAIIAIINGLRSAFSAIASGARQAVAAVFEWWRMRERIPADDEVHTLSFEGSEDDAELFFSSTPTRLRAYLGSLRGGEFSTPVQRQRIAAINVQINQYADLRGQRRAAKSANNAEQIRAKDLAIRAEFMAIRDALRALFAGDTDYGSQADPIRLAWPFPPSVHYPTLYFGGRLDGAKRSQIELKADMKAGREVGGVDVSEYRPHARRALPGGEVIGLSSGFFLRAGTIVGPLSDETTGGGGQLGRILTSYGYAGSEETPKLDLDHVHEIQFGGRALNDTVANLWPLDYSINRSKGPTLGQARVTYPENAAPPLNTTIADLKRLANKRRRRLFFKAEGLVG